MNTDILMVQNDVKIHIYLIKTSTLVFHKPAEITTLFIKFPSEVIHFCTFPCFQFSNNQQQHITASIGFIGTATFCCISNNFADLLICSFTTEKYEACFKVEMLNYRGFDVYVTVISVSPTVLVWGSSVQKRGSLSAPRLDMYSPSCESTTHSCGMNAFTEVKKVLHLGTHVILVLAMCIITSDSKYNKGYLCSTDLWADQNWLNIQICYKYIQRCCGRVLNGLKVLLSSIFEHLCIGLLF